MAFRHGKDTFVSVDGVDLSAFTNSTSFGDETEANETTTYGRTRKTYIAGMGDGKITIGGPADDGAAAARKTLKPLKAAGTEVQFIFRPYGVGSGKQQSIVNVIITSFNDSAEVGDVVKWTCEMQETGPLDETDQA